MRYGMNMPAFGEFGDARALADLARDAERAGWDGFFIWDHMIFDPTFNPMVDPWVGLAACAMQTETIRLGTLLTPLPRRRPWKLARETTSLDRLSGGRLTLGVGIGDPAQWEFGWFHEPTDPRQRAEMLDEGLAVLDGLWRGERFSFAGDHYQIEEMIFQPRPVQRPRIPIWVGGYWPRRPPFRRAARWDGVCPGHADNRPLTVADWREIMAFIGEHRTVATPFDAVHSGTTGANLAEERATIAELETVGVTWFIEDISPWRFGGNWEEPIHPEHIAAMVERVRNGPPA